MYMYPFVHGAMNLSREYKGEKGVSHPIRSLTSLPSGDVVWCPGVSRVGLISLEFGREYSSSSTLPNFPPLPPRGGSSSSSGVSPIQELSSFRR